jgi:hypothetical protein
VRGGNDVATNGNQLRNDAEGDFFRGERTDIETHGSEDALEFIHAVAFFFESAINAENLAFAANHADVASLGAYGPGEHAHIFFVAASYDYQIAGGVWLQFGESVVEAGVDFLGYGEALTVGECFAVVDDNNTKTCGLCGLGDSSGDVTGAEEINDGLGEDGLDEDFDGAAADQAIVVGGFVVEMEDEFSGSFFLHHFFGSGPDVGFDAAATDGAGGGAVLSDEHAGAFVAGDGAVGVDNGGECTALAGAPHADDLFEQIHGDSVPLVGGERRERQEKALPPFARALRASRGHRGRSTEFAENSVARFTSGMAVMDIEVGLMLLCEAVSGRRRA